MKRDEIKAACTAPDHIINGGLTNKLSEQWVFGKFCVYLDEDGRLWLVAEPIGG